MKNVTISILIPVYNTGKTLGACIDSVLDQTFSDIEIICVDDGSDEETKEVLEEYSAKDDRIQVITLQQNRGALYARSKAIEVANGKYIMFLDGDDGYMTDTCERAWKAIEEKNVDILQFGTKVVAESTVSQERIDAFKKYMATPKNALHDKEVFIECFSYGKMHYGWHLWNKIFVADILKKTVPYTPEERCVVATDFYLYFLASYFANSYDFITDELICYNFGSGVSATKEFTLQVYKNNLTRKVACNAVENFLRQQNPADNVYYEELQKWEDDCLKVSVWQFVKNCKIPWGKEAFDLLVSAYPMERVVKKIINSFGINETVRISKLIYKANCIAPFKKEIKTVGFFYHRFANGGVQRVLSKLIPLFTDWGYNTVFFVEEESDSDYVLPVECKKIIIPSSLSGISKEQYLEHAEAFRQNILDKHVDLVLYQATTSPYFLYDILIAKSAGANVVGTLHELVALPLLRTYEMFTKKQYVFRIADGIQTLIRSDCSYLRSFGVNAGYIPNPVTYPTSEKIQQERNKSILWCGRLSEFQKQTEHAILIMEKVVRALPDAHMYIVGKGVSETDDKRYNELVNRKGLSDNITMVGYLKEPKDYYMSCGVLLITSLFEVSPMVMSEGLSCGMPIVTYDMPYVEFLRQGAKIECVEQGDIDSAARALVKILKDDSLLSGMAQSSLDLARSFENVDLRGMWGEFINELPDRSYDVDSNMLIGLENILDFYDYGNINRKKQEVKLQQNKKNVEKKAQTTSKEEITQNKNIIEDTSVPIISYDGPLTLKEKISKYWVDHGTFALMRKGIVYVYRKIFKKKDKPHKSQKYTYSYYISLGYNKEADYRINAHLQRGKNRSQMISAPWSYLFEPENLAEALENPEKILSSGLEFKRDGEGYVKDAEFGFMFRLKGYKAKDFYTETGFANDLKMKEAIAVERKEIAGFFSRCSEIFSSSKKVLFVIKAKPNITDFGWINSLSEYLKKNLNSNRYKLLVVAETKLFEQLKNSKDWVRSRNIVIAPVKKFASDSNVMYGGDIAGWQQILASVEIMK